MSTIERGRALLAAGAQGEWTRPMNRTIRTHLESLEG